MHAPARRCRHPPPPPPPPPPAKVAPPPPLPTLQGTSGNAVQYVTRNQALKKLQLKLSEFRRLCILKGIHPREPKKKPQVGAAGLVAAVLRWCPLCWAEAGVPGAVPRPALPPSAVYCTPPLQALRHMPLPAAPPTPSNPHPASRTPPCAQGQNKTYYHVKDIAYLLHEPLLKKARELYAYEKKVGRRGRWRMLCGGGVRRAGSPRHGTHGARLLRAGSCAHAARRPRCWHPMPPQVRRAKAKKNRDLAARLAARKPTYRLDHLVRER